MEKRTESNRKTGAPRGNGNARKHGYHSAVAVLKPHGLDGIDQRSSAAKVANAFREEVVEALGGSAAISPQQERLIELAAVELLLVRHVDAYLLEQETLLVGRGKQKRLLPVLTDRGRHASFFASLMKDLGLERRAKPVESLDEYVARKYGNRKTLGSDGESEGEVHA